MSRAYFLVAVVFGLSAIVFTAHKLKTVDSEAPKRTAPARSKPEKVTPTQQSESKNPDWLDELPADQKSYVAEHVKYGVPSRANETHEELLLARRGYVIAHSSRHKIPTWVAYRLVPAHTYGSEKRTNDYQPDPQLQIGKRAELSDYRNSGWSRGHMCPAGDSKGRGWFVMSQSFYLSNMCPQASELNNGRWRSLESHARKVAERVGEVWVIAGPVILDENNDGVSDLRIGLNRVAVPAGFYKILVAKSQQPGVPAVLAFVMGNRESPLGLEFYLVTVDDVEAATGLDFFHELPDHVEDAVESARPTRLWI